MAWHDKINSKQLCSSRPPCTINHHYNYPFLIFKMGGRIFSPVSLILSFPPFSPQLLLLFVSPSLSFSVFLSVFVLWLPAHEPGLELHLPALCRLSDSMTQSTAMPAERGVGVGGCWGSFRTVSLSTWANRKREVGEMLVGKPSTNWLGGAGRVTANVQ